MAKHRARRSSRRALIGFVALVFASTMAVTTSASASSGARLRIVGQDQVVKYNCQFTVSSVNSGVVAGTLAGNAFPASLSGYFSIAHNTIHCYLYDSSGANLLAVLQTSANSPSVSGSTPIAVPELTSYLLCGNASATTKNGTIDTAPLTCAAG